MRIPLQYVLAVIGMIGISMGAEQAEAAFDPERLTIGGEIRERYEFRNNADFTNAISDTLSFVGSRIRLHVGYAITPDIVFFAQLQDSRTFGSESSTASNEKNLDLHQGYLIVKNLAGPLMLTLGRQEMVFGDSRLVGNFGWSNMGRSFDALRLTYAIDIIRVDLWAAVTKVAGSNTGADPALSPANREAQQLYGIYAVVKTGFLSIEPYVIYLRDTANANEVTSTGALVSPITAPAARGQNRVTVGLRVDGRAAGNAVDYTAEGAYQLGTMEARGTTPRTAISAYAVAVKVGYTAPVAVKPRIGVEYDHASGDDNPTDHTFKTFENLFPTNHIHYGYMDYVGWRNMQDIRISFEIKPTTTSGMSVDGHFLWLADKADHWYAASGQIFRTTPAGNSQTALGQEIDLVAYAMIKERLRLEAGYSHFFPGDYVRTNFPLATDGSDFAYLQTGLNF
jgi:Alginate export